MRVASSSPALRRLTIEPQWPRVRQVVAVPTTLQEPVHRAHRQQRTIATERPLDRAPAKRDPPHAVAALEAVEIPATENRCRPSVPAAHGADDVALGMRLVAVDLT